LLLSRILFFKTSSKKNCRDIIKKKNAYVIVRELHKWDKDEKVIETCEKLVAILIADEPEEYIENLHQVDIPENLSKKFFEYDAKDLERKFD
jgi:hypothetical protein